MTSAAAGGRLTSGSYKLTRQQLYFEAGLMSSKGEQIPLWAVRDVDIAQSMSQKARGVGDVTVRCLHDEYTGRAIVRLESVDDPHRVRDLINDAAAVARLAYQEHQARIRGMHYQPQVVVHAGNAPAPETAPPAPAKDLMAQLRELGELRDGGVLTEDEFQAQKAKLLG
jgi:hypothetical protein